MTEKSKKLKDGKCPYCGYGDIMHTPTKMRTEILQCGKCYKRIDNG